MNFRSQSSSWYGNNGLDYVYSLFYDEISQFPEILALYCLTRKDHSDLSAGAVYTNRIFGLRDTREI